MLCLKQLREDLCAPLLHAWFSIHINRPSSKNDDDLEDLSLLFVQVFLKRLRHESDELKCRMSQRCSRKVLDMVSVSHRPSRPLEQSEQSMQAEH